MNAKRRVLATRRDVVDVKKEEKKKKKKERFDGCIAYYILARVYNKFNLIFLAYLGWNFDVSVLIWKEDRFDKRINICE